jgi:hypothetical protein
VQLRQSSFAAYPALVGAASGVVLLASLSDAAQVAWPPASGALPPVAQEVVQLIAPILRRCPTCGWIESKRELVPDVADAEAPKTYEYTMRKADGSGSLFQETLPTTWRIGERMMLVE